ncbi:DMT family transporter [Devosia sp.]|uniref:DMT family transporter n=1 Tax=Devosia sp. TaxID=1871048 RepID=UPI002F04BF15
MPAAPLREGSIFTDPRVVFATATLCCLLWGSAFPAIKAGYALFAIAPADVPSQMLFAGTRFTLAGAILLAYAALSGRRLWLTPRQAGQVLLLGLTQTAIQYVFFYIGLAHASGVKASIVNATTIFFSVLLAHFLYRNDRLNAGKSLGVLLGFAGVVVVNLRGAGLDFEFTLLGEGFIAIAAFILAAAMIYGKRVSQGLDATVMTGWQLALGGLMLWAAALPLGGEMAAFDAASAALLVYLALLSAVAYALWSVLLKHNPVGMVAIYNFLIPVFGVVLSALLLGETLLEWKNLAALVLVSAGIWLVSRSQGAPVAHPPAA